MDKKNPVIAGMGIFCSAGQNMNEFTEALKSGKSNFSYREPESPQHTYTDIRARVENFNCVELLKKYISIDHDVTMKKFGVLRRMPLYFQVTAMSCLEAWENSKKYAENIPAERKALVAAGNDISSGSQYEIFKKYGDEPQYVSASAMLQCMDTQLIGTLSELFDIRGCGFTVGGASASGNAALIQALWLLRTGQADWCMVVGPVFNFSPLELQGLYNLSAIGGAGFENMPQEASRPFDQKHGGFIPGEAGACIILVNPDKLDDGQMPACSLTGGAQLLHGSKFTEPSLDAEERVMYAALKDAGLKAEEIDYVNAHGTSTPLGDKTEIEAIEHVFSDTKEKIMVNSTKGIIGHCMYSAGITEAIATAVQLENGFVHGNKNLENPVENQLGLTKEMMEPVIIEKALSNSFGFHGINTSIVIEKNNR